MKLIDMDGSLIHQWKVSFNKIWPVASHLDRQPAEFEREITGAKLYKNGDIVFNFSRQGIVKIDKCSNVIWKWPIRAHHSVYEDKDGNYWFPAEKELGKPYKFSEGILIRQPEYVFKVSPEGKILKEISILESIKNSNLIAQLLPVGKQKLELNWKGVQYTHLNSVKVLEKPMADAFPNFSAGDILISLRNFNVIMVIDLNTELVKWSMTGPFIRQHDPDFLNNGHISVFDNRGSNVSGDAFGDSRILDIDPVTKKTKIIYEGNKNNPFYSKIRGNHQHLPNGNILITESNAGRIFEVNSSREIVWSFIDRWDEKQIAIIYQAERYPVQFGKFSKDQCK